MKGGLFVGGMSIAAAGNIAAFWCVAVAVGLVIAWRLSYHP